MPAEQARLLLRPAVGTWYVRGAICGSAKHRPAATLERAPSAGRRCIVLDAPITVPQPLPGGAQLVEWGAHDGSSPRPANRPSSPTRSSSASATTAFAKCDDFAGAGDYAGLREAILCGAATKGEVVSSFLDREHWDFCFACSARATVRVITSGATTTRHTPPTILRPRVRQLGDVLLDVYEALDASLGRCSPTSPMTHRSLSCSATASGLTTTASTSCRHPARAGRPRRHLPAARSPRAVIRRLSVEVGRRANSKPLDSSPPLLQGSEQRRCTRACASTSRAASPGSRRSRRRVRRDHREAARRAARDRECGDR